MVACMNRELLRATFSSAPFRIATRAILRIFFVCLEICKAKFELVPQLHDVFQIVPVLFFEPLRYQGDELKRGGWL
jgi:hypothetical protein